MSDKAVKYKGYTITKQDERYLITDFGVPVADAKSIQEAKEIIDSGSLL